MGVRCACVVCWNIHIHVHRRINRFSVSNKTAMQSARARSGEWAKGINATLIETALVDCDMLTQLCRKFSTTTINCVYLARKRTKAKADFLSKHGHFFTLSLPLPNVEGNNPRETRGDATTMTVHTWIALLEKYFPCCLRIKQIKCRHEWI